MANTFAVATVVSTPRDSDDLRHPGIGIHRAHPGGMATTKTTATMLTLCVLAGVATGCDAQGETVGPRGGIVMSDDGLVTLEIPEGALMEDVEITIEAVDADVDSDTTVYAIEPAGFALLRPATLSYDLATSFEERSLELSATDMNDLVLVSEKAGRWHAMSDRDVDMDAGILSASVLFFSSYTVVSR